MFILVCPRSCHGCWEAEIGEGEASSKVPAKEGSVSLQYPLLTSSNYVAWSMKMRVYMEAQGVWDVVEAVAGEVDNRHDKKT